jgi:hypothetical protein
VIIDLEVAKRQLDLVNSDNDDRVMTALDAAVAVVLDYLKVPADTYLDSSTGVYDVPAIEGAAILGCLDTLFRDPTADPLTDRVRSVLHRRRDPAMA